MQAGDRQKVILHKVTGSDRLFTVTGMNNIVGWRCVYLGYNIDTDLTRFNLSRYRRLIPNDQILLRPAERMSEYGFKFELKVTNKLQPSIFWGEQGKQLLREVAIFLEQPSLAKGLPMVRSVVYPFKVGSAVQVWINGQYAMSLSNHPEELTFIKALMQYQHCKPAVILHSIKTFQLPEENYGT